MLRQELAQRLDRRPMSGASPYYQGENVLSRAGQAASGASPVLPPHLAYGQLQAVLGPSMPLTSFHPQDVQQGFDLLQSNGEMAALDYMRQRRGNR